MWKLGLAGLDLLEIPYGEVHHLQGRDEDEKHSFVFQNIYHSGDTKSAQELEVFLRMSRERLRLCCGLQCTDRLHPNGPRQRQKLHTAALKLLWFAVGIDSSMWKCGASCLVCCHVATSPPWGWARLGYVECYCTCLVWRAHWIGHQWVFGAGKTRSAAVLLAGLLVFDPSLNGPHQGKYCGPCRCWAPGVIAIAWLHPRKDGAPGWVLWTGPQGLIHSPGHSSFQSEPGHWSLPRGWRPTIRQYGRGCHSCKNSSYLFGGVVWWPPTNSRWIEKESRG